MESNNCLLFEMRMLNELRKLKPVQRKEIIETLEREEKLEEEALKKNPNLHMETKLTQVLGELKDLRTEMQVIKNTSYCNNCPISNGNGISNGTNGSNRIQVCALAGLDERLRAEDEASNCNECSLFSSSIDWWPILIFAFIFLSLLSFPGSKGRPCPVSL